jgi:hypothetical protein
MLWVVVALYLTGGVLPIAGVVRAVTVAQRRYRELDKQLSAIDEIGHRPENQALDASEQVQQEMYAVLQPKVAYWYRMEYAAEIAEREMLALLKKPAVLAGVGILAGMAGSLLSLTLY